MHNCPLPGPPPPLGSGSKSLKVLLAFDTSLQDASSAVVSFLRQMQPLTKSPVHAASLRRTPSFSWVSGDHTFFLFFLSLLRQYLLFSVLYLHCFYPCLICILLFPGNYFLYMYFFISCPSEFLRRITYHC